MSIKGSNILKQYQRRWQALLWLEVLILAISGGILVYLWSSSTTAGVIGLIATLLLGAYILQPWKISLKDASVYLDKKIDSLEYSTSLFLKPQPELSDIARLQLNRISEKIKNEKQILPPIFFKEVGLVTIILLVLGVIGFQTNIQDYFKTTVAPESQDQMIQFQAADSIMNSSIVPKLVDQQLSIRYPAYTKIGTINSSDMNIRALEGSQVIWSLQFNKDLDSVGLQSMGSFKSMRLQDQSYSGSSTLTTSGFYNFKFFDKNGTGYSSDLYTIEVFKDASPKVEISGVDQFTSFNYFDQKKIQFNTKISDDFGIQDAYIIATVSKGSGESVKFREEKLTFNEVVGSGKKSVDLTKSIDLDQMNMEPGDELYFYVETMDQKRPTPNITRSETLFAVIKDTTSYEFSTEGTLGVDRMPDYFRSQRQLIIDTEKLIKDKPNLSEKDFKFKSNELGFDQKSLRLKYAEFMGEEVDSGLDIDTEDPVAEEDDHEGEEEEDPLAEYTHDHDNENEHNIVDEEHDDEEDAKNPLSKYVHDHSDPESATLFEESLKTKLRKALNEMWDAELYLRLYTPEESLPYQYRALNLIQEIKNSARIYVHRIGFDPPPIKEDKRLSGKLDEVKSFRKNESMEIKDNYPSMSAAIALIETLLHESRDITPAEQQLFELCGNELATIAIEFPGKHLQTLQDLRLLTEGIENSEALLSSIQNGLISALPKPMDNPGKSTTNQDELNQLLLKELMINDR